MGVDMQLNWLDQTFDGATYEPEKDQVRLGKQAQIVFTLMEDQCWRTLREIEDRTGFPQASISARLRDFRKDRFGGHGLERRRKNGGTFEYRLVVNENP